MRRSVFFYSIAVLLLSTSASADEVTFTNGEGPATL